MTTILIADDEESIRFTFETFLRGAEFEVETAEDFGKAQASSLFDCIECGSCSYVCPSHIPLVQYFQFAKSEIRAREQDNKAAERARERHEYREFRFEREKKEKAEKLAAKEKAVREAVATNSSNAAVQPEIQAAIDRAKEQAAGVEPKNTDNPTAQQQSETAGIEAQREHIRERAKSAVEHTNGHDKN